MVADISVGTDTIVEGVSSVRGSAFANTIVGYDNAAGTVQMFDGRGGDDIIGKGGFAPRGLQPGQHGHTRYHGDAQQLRRRLDRRHHSAGPTRSAARARFGLPGTCGPRLQGKIVITRQDCSPSHRRHQKWRQHAWPCSR